MYNLEDSHSSNWHSPVMVRCCNVKVSCLYTCDTNRPTPAICTRTDYWDVVFSNYTNRSSDLDQAVMLVAYISGVSGSNFGRNTNCHN
jgi:hypothetical protein